MTPSNSFTMLDPTAETTPVMRERLAPSTQLEHAVVGLLSISKRRSDEFLDRVEQRLRTDGVDVRRFAKPSHSKPAPDGVLQDIVERCDVVVEALAD